MRIKLNEHGRSMVEILGVLAIIGILSIGGMAGYQYAYSSYQAGQIQDVIGKAKLLAAQNNRSSHVKEVRRFVENMLSKYKPADTTPMVTHRDGKYIVDLFNVSDSVCEKLQNRRDIFNSMRIGMTPEACTTAEMSMQFTFDSIVIGGSGSGGAESGYDDPNNPDIGRCPDKQVWRQKEDGTYGCVCRHDYEYGEDCTRCEPPRSWNQGNQSCQCPADKPIWEYGVCKCIADTDCQYSGTGFCCDDTEQVCRQCDETDCDKTKGLILADGRCVCSGRKEWRQDEGDSEPSCKCPVNTPAEANPETCECPDGKDNVDEDGDGINECVISCPSDTGFTGLRNRTTGNCLCDTGAGYKAESEMVGGVQTCVCDESKNYYSAQGKCVKCDPVDEAWVEKRKSTMIGGEITDFNSVIYTDAENPRVWYCGIKSFDGSAVQKIFNPSTNAACAVNDVLIKGSDGKFKCSDHCYKTGQWNTNYRGTPWGWCGCRFFRTWQNKKCISTCPAGYYERNGKCDPCGINSWTFNGTTCRGPTCNGKEPWTDGSENFNYETWLKKTPDSCHTIQSSGRALQTETGACSYKYGCVLSTLTPPKCSIGVEITSACECASGDKTGICCSVSTYPTSTGCVSCPAGQVPNSSRTGCESCPRNKITKDGKCVKCDKGYYPSSQQNRCLACPADRTTDEDGLTCSICVDSDKIFNMITNKCECKDGYEENPVNGSCMLFEDEMPENTEEEAENINSIEEKD
ncbi:MAG: hypothetical protein E7014_03085 [Alphaproteobacteria bacterium]|nr:hypothetical protein [Alphaproteobacteria bacterium]